VEYYLLLVPPRSEKWHFCWHTNFKPFLSSGIISIPTWSRNMWWRRSLIVFRLHLKVVMNNIRQFYCQRLIMNGLRFISDTLSLLKITIMLFIRSASNYDFMRKNHYKRTRLKRLFVLYSLLIWSYNINIGSRTTNTMLSSFVTYSRLRSMMNLILRIITNVVLGLLLFLRPITMRRICIELFFPRKIIQRKMVGPLDADTICVRINSLQTQWKRMVLPLKEVIFNAGHAVILSTLLRNVVHPST
jgi:hypothetical protein